MTVAVNVNVKLGHVGEYHFQQQLGSAPEPQSANGNGHNAGPGHIVPQTSSVIAPGLARRLPA